ncbi:MAG: hypothetical protein IJC59_04815 [Lachnospiraceae bacterium]|nr:hypothetical protein [Lachnospiraceae bacterium]
MNSILANIGSSLTGNITKAILFIKDVKPGQTQSIEEVAKEAEALQQKLLSGTAAALKGSKQGSKSFSSVTSAAKGADSLAAGSGFLALEVQFNPNSLYFETVAGRDVEYDGGNLGTRSTNQIVQVKHPAATTLSFELIFDDFNPQDAFMVENIGMTAGNLVTMGGSTVKKVRGGKYSVQPQMDGLISLMTRNETRQVIFFWGKMCFPGELVNVNCRYTMFNRAGNPIRGVVRLSIRQGENSKYTQNSRYWNEAFGKLFGKGGINSTSKATGGFSKATNNNFLNLNL